MVDKDEREPEKRTINNRYEMGHQPVHTGGAMGLPLLAREIKRRILTSWDRVEGDKILERVAKEDPLAYLRLILTLLTDRKTDVTVIMQRTIGDTDAASGFLDSCRRAARHGPLTRDIIIEHLSRNNGRQQSYGAKLLPRIGGKG